MLEPGVELDREIARKLNGEVKPRPAPYSTSETAAGRLLRRLAADGTTSTLEVFDGQWHCTLRRGEPGGARRRVSIGSGSTRPLAIARAVLRAPLEASEPVRAGEAHRLLLRGFARAEQGGFPCRTCGQELPVRTRRQMGRQCAVCSWKRMKVRSQAITPPMNS